MYFQEIEATRKEIEATRKELEAAKVALVSREEVRHYVSHKAPSSLTVL